MSSPHPIIEVSVEPIELCKLLKIANLVSGGGEAKIVISEGYVLVNDELEYQKRKKIYHGDIVEFNGEIIEVAYRPKQPVQSQVNSPDDKKDTQSATATKKYKVKKSKNSQAGKTKSSPDIAPAGKRKPISF